MSLQQKVSEASFSFQGKSSKCQRFIICLFIRGWYLTSLPPPPPAPGSHPPQSLFYHKRNKLAFELYLDLRKSQLNLEWANYLATSGCIAITSYFKNNRPTWITIASDVRRPLPAPNSYHPLISQCQPGTIFFRNLTLKKELKDPRMTHERGNKPFLPPEQVLEMLSRQFRSSLLSSLPLTSFPPPPPGSRRPASRPSWSL